MDADRVKRADAHLTIAQFRFKQAMKTAEQPDASASLPAVTDESTTHFCNALEAVLQQNKPANIQTCKRWIVQHVAPSSSRTAVLGEYLVAVSRSIVVDQNAKTNRAARNRLDILLVVSDVLHADRFHGRNHGKDLWVARQLKPYIEDLVELAALLIDGKDTAHEKKLKAVLNFWAASQCISADAYRSIRERFADGLLVAQGGTPVRKRTYALPERFGDQNAPWHELPASYMVDCLIERPDRPITTSSIRALRPERRQPSEHVRGLLEEYFENIDLKYIPTGDNPTGETKKYRLWLDPMGQLVKQDKTTGETKTVYNGYGWSLKFCQDMRRDKVPSRIAEKRKSLRENIRLIEEKQREETLRKRSRPSLSPSPPRRRRRYSSSASDRGSDDYRSRSPDSDRERQHDGRRQPSRDGGTTYNRPSLFDNPRDIGPDRQPLQWNPSQNSHPRANRNTHRGAGNNGNATGMQGVQPPPPPPGQGQFPVSFAPHLQPQPPRYQEPSPPNPADFNRSAFAHGVIWVPGTPGVRLPITPEEYDKNPALYNQVDYGGQWEGGSRGGPGGGFGGGYGRGYQGNSDRGYQGRRGGPFQRRGGNRGGNNRGQWNGRRRG